MYRRKRKDPPASSALSWTVRTWSWYSQALRLSSNKPSTSTWPFTCRHFNENVIVWFREHPESNQRKREQSDFVLPLEPKILHLVELCLIQNRIRIVIGVDNLLHDHVELPHVLDLAVHQVILVSAQVLWVLTLNFGLGLDNISSFNFKEVDPFNNWIPDLLPLQYDTSSPKGRFQIFFLKSMEFSITGRGGVYPIPHFFYYLFSDSKVTIFSKILGFLLVFCLQIRPLIPSHSIPFLSNPIIFNTIIHLSPNPKGRKMRQKTTQICPLDVKKNHK